jgi:hypothetical protein
MLGWQFNCHPNTSECIETGWHWRDDFLRGKGQVDYALSCQVL